MKIMPSDVSCFACDSSAMSTRWTERFINTKTKVITGINTRLSYFHGWELVSINGGAEKYSVSVLIPKDDTETVNVINAAIDAAIEEGISKFGGKKPNKAAIKLYLRDGDVGERR